MGATLFVWLNPYADVCRGLVGRRRRWFDRVLVWLPMAPLRGSPVIAVTPEDACAVAVGDYRVVGCVLPKIGRP